MKKIALLMIMVGISLFIVGGIQFIQTNVNQKEALAEAKTVLYNSTLKEPDPVGEGSTLSINSTEFAPETGETIGILHIPKLEADLPIIEGTDADELAKGVGHYKGTAFPTQNDQIVLSGHRDTVFRNIGQLDVGDLFIVKLPYGEFSYEIVKTNIVDADNTAVITPTSPKEVLTLTTCYPFNFIGDAPERYIITAIPILKIDE
jgi:sortase A